MQTESLKSGRTLTTQDASRSRIPAHRHPRIGMVLGGIVAAFVLAGAVICAAAGLDTIMTFLSVPALVWVLAAPPILLACIYGPAGLVDAFAYAFRQPTPSETAADAMTLFRLWAAYALAAGFMATIVGLVAMLAALDDPAHLGQGMATALLSQLYGVFVAVICVSVSAAIGRRHNGPEGIQRLGRQSASVAGLTIVAGCMTTLVAFGLFMLAMPTGY